MSPSAMPPSSTTDSSQRSEPGSVNIAIARWPPSPTASDGRIDARTIAAETVQAFNSHLPASPSRESAQGIASLFLDDSYWRDHLALSWDPRTLKGRSQVASFLQDNSRLTRVELDTSTEWRSPRAVAFNPRGSARGIQFYTTFTTEVGSGRGIVRMAEENGEWKIWTFFTALEEIKGHEEPLGPRRPDGVVHGANPERKNWTDRRREESSFEHSDPDVLIIGAGQGGLTAAARLKKLNVPSLIIDFNDAVGDNWRKRYHQLVLHDPIWYDHLPYLPFPPSWPIYTPKDKLADFFDSYAKLLELNIWTKSTVDSSTSWDDNKKRWTVTIKRTLPDGKVASRTLHPKHIIQATGHSGKKNFPEIKGMEGFNGDILCHSSEFAGARPNSKGKKAVVVGACNSSHDICQDYYENGYDVTMVQRSSTCVVTSSSIVDSLKGTYEEGGPPVEDADVYSFGWPAEVLKALHFEASGVLRRADAATLEGLEKAGFKLDSGPDDCGLNIKYFQRGGGYYIDVGASQLIIDGKIKVKQGQEVAEILPHGLKFADGTELEADEVIFATGYQNMRTQARAIFGDGVADRVGDVWGYDETGEVRALWRKSGHPGFWFHGGNLALCRYYSRVLALQIMAQLEGLE